jgi:hypothetical protein
MLWLAFAVLTAPAQSQDNIHLAITGVVVDENEMAVKGVIVRAWPSGGVGGVLPFARTNENGEFLIDSYWSNITMVTAEYPELGYPRPFFNFYGVGFPNSAPVQITGSTAAPVRIKLAPKAGRLVFTIFEGQTNARVLSGGVSVCRVSGPHSCWHLSTEFANGQYELLTPDAPFTIKFQTWWGGDSVDRKAFDDSGLPVETLQLPLGARKEMTIRLQ